MKYENWNKAGNFREEDYKNENPNLGGFMNARGTNYAGAKFSGAAYGHGMEADKYRSYYNNADREKSFADQYRQRYSTGDNFETDETRYGLRSQFRNTNISNRSNETSAFNLQNRGKGPRGYQRSDKRIYEDVNEQLYEDDLLDATDIDVKVENGNVILSGEVESRFSKHRAEDIAEDVPGVLNVENRLHVRRGIVKDFTRAITAGISDAAIGYDKEHRW